MSAGDRSTTPVDTNGSNGGGVAEGAANGTAVGITAFSTDPNGPAPTYALTNDAGGRFAIDPSTGIVTVANSALIDFEGSGPSHTYTITARATRISELGDWRPTTDERAEPRQR